MLYPTTISRKWQMTIPKEARKALDIKNPGRVFLDVDLRKKVIAVKKAPSFLELAGTFVPKKHKNVSVLTARDYMEKYYERV